MKLYHTKLTEIAITYRMVSEQQAACLFSQPQMTQYGYGVVSWVCNKRSMRFLTMNR